ncbi:hypothetical protein MES5069_450070 [Mesorhizobium escarrei]|uniref:Uncharacterized protein n=1 Tax=Mesorhizobium escarrei TaxID=666018 RepID=A0ABM9E7N2_9HYPH|nr:hypothetical protein MES5069_450070 [Mesorhizobium escarrei]
MSWQIGRRPNAAMREFSRICPMAFFADGLYSRAYACEKVPDIVWRMVVRDVLKGVGDTPCDVFTGNGACPFVHQLLPE